MATDLYRCTEPYVDYTNGREHVRMGRIVTADSPLYRGREHFFEPVMAQDAPAEVRAAQTGRRGAVERMTAAPGERRDVAIPRDQADEHGHVERLDGEPIASAVEPPPEDAVLDCPDCDFTTSSRAGLASHRRSHK